MEANYYFSYSEIVRYNNVPITISIYKIGRPSPNKSIVLRVTS